MRHIRQSIFYLLLMCFCLSINIDAEAKDKTGARNISFQGTIKSGVYLLNKDLLLVIGIELTEYPGNLFLLAPGSNAAKSIANPFTVNRKVFIRCRKGKLSDLSDFQSKEIANIYQIIEAKYK